MEREFIGKIGVFVVGFLLFIAFNALFGTDITGQAIGLKQNISLNINIGFALIILALIVLIVFMITGGNAKDILKTLVGSFSIFAGFYLMSKLVHDPDVIIAIISITFGVMAMIWIMNAHYVLSKGSSLRGYSTSFFLCVLFLVMFSVYDTIVSVLDIKAPYIYIKHLLITMVYIIFVNTAYKMYKIGKEFGFYDAGKSINDKIKSNIKKTSK